MIPHCGDRLIVKLVQSPGGAERELTGNVIDIFGDTVLAQLYEPGKPAVRRSLKKSQLRPGGPGVWRAVLAARTDAAPSGDQPATS